MKHQRRPIRPLFFSRPRKLLFFPLSLLFSHCLTFLRNIVSYSTLTLIFIRNNHLALFLMHFYVDSRKPRFSHHLDADVITCLLVYTQLENIVRGEASITTSRLHLPISVAGFMHPTNQHRAREQVVASLSMRPSTLNGTGKGSYRKRRR